MVQTRKNYVEPRRTGERASDGRESPCCDLQALLDPTVFKALSDPNRLVLLSRLAASSEPRTVGQLNSCCPVDLSVVSRHLAVLRDAELLTAEKRGREVYYELCCRPVAQWLRQVAEALEACAAGQTTNMRRGSDEDE